MPVRTSRTRQWIQSLPDSPSPYAARVPSGLSATPLIETLPSGENSNGSMSTLPPSTTAGRSSATCTLSWSRVPSLWLNRYRPPRLRGTPVWAVPRIAASESANHFRASRTARYGSLS